jgi:hypothetical protein
VMPVTYLSRGLSISFGYTARMGSIDTILNVGPQWATTSIRRCHSISREIRQPRRFSVSFSSISMILRRYIRRGTRRSLVSGERSFVRPLINKILYRAGKAECIPFPKTGDKDLSPGISRNYEIYDPLDFLAEVTQHIVTSFCSVRSIGAAHHAL